MLFLGHTRFSLLRPHSDAWRVSNGSFATDAEYRDYLFSDRRMARRCDIFLNLSLPQIAAAATRWPIRHVVSYSDSLPEKYRRQLALAAARHPFLILDEQTATSIGVKDERELVARFAPSSPGVVGAYRLDDDDLLSADYFEQVAPYMRPDNAGMLVSLAAGLTSLHDEDGRFSAFRESYVPMIAIGLLSICRVEGDGSVVAPVWSPHSRADRHNPVILDSRRPSYLWIRHQDQDTTMDYGEVEAISRVLDHLAARPLVEDVAVDELFPALAPRIRPMERVELTAAPHDLVDPFSVAFDHPVQGMFNLSVEVTCGAGVVANNVLVSLDIVDGDGRIPAPEQRVAGAAWSPNPGIGFYRYVPTQEGARTSTHDLILPPGYSCRGLTLRIWRRAETQARLGHVSLLRATPATTR